MTDEAHPQLDRITELLADRALFGLSDSEQRELDQLLQSNPDIDASAYDQIAAAGQLATLGTIDAMPAELANKISAQAKSSFGEKTEEAVMQLPSADEEFPRRELTAWLAAAAAILVALFTWTGGGQQQSVALKQSPSALKTELLALASTDADELTRVSWSAGSDPAGQSASGEVVWHNGRQQGVMTFANLPANDPSKSQYQLWIFDAEQDERYPIDGGVFDIPAGATEALVKIDAKLPVVTPTLFAITIEKPGGVVVSSRERLPLLAQVATN